MSFFEKNLAALKERDPETASWIESAEKPGGLEVIASRSGLPVPRIGRTALHSSYHPEREGERFSDPRAHEAQAAVFGFGFGYHLEKIAFEAQSVTVIEPSPGLLRAAFEARDLARLLERVRIVPPEKFNDIAGAFDYSRAVWLDHEPSARLHEKERNLLAEPFIVRSIAASRRYKVMVIGPVYGGSVPTAVSTARALEALGFDADFVDNTPRRDELFSINAVTPDEGNRAALRTIYNNYLGERIAARADHTKPDMILALAQAPLNTGVLGRLKNLGVPIIFWFVENHRALPYWKSVAPHYDYFFGIQKGEFPEMLLKAGAPYAGYLPQAADPAVHRPLILTADEREKYGSPVSFMGAGYPNRRAFFSALLDTPLKIWGTEWDLASPVGKRVQNANRRLGPEEYVKIFNASAVNLNLHSSTTSAGVDPLTDFVNPRTFEIAACGAFGLVDNRRELAQMFEPDVEMAPFDGIGDLREKIDHYLKHPEEREAIAMAARQRVLKEHTFVHRMASMMSVVIPREEERIEQARSRRRGINDVDAILARTDNAQLSAFLEKFRGTGNLSLAKVMEAIESGEGELSRPEAIFAMIGQIVTQGE